MRLITKGGHDWTGRFLWTLYAVRKNRGEQFIIVGEAVVLDVNGWSSFEELHSGKFKHVVQLYAFDLIALDGDDLHERHALRRHRVRRTPSSSTTKPRAGIPKRDPMRISVGVTPP